MRTLVPPPLIPKILLIRKVPSAKGDEGMLEGVRGTSIGVGRVVAYD